jgi:hypothetical protein
MATFVVLLTLDAAGIGALVVGEPGPFNDAPCPPLTSHGASITSRVDSP